MTYEKDRFYQRVGVAIRSARNEGGMSQEALAKASKVTLSTVQNAEIGQSCSLLLLAKLAHALDTTLDALVPLDALEGGSS